MLTQVQASFAVNALTVSMAGITTDLDAPALTVFIATNYQGDSQARAIGLLAAAIPLAGVLALVIAGWFAETIGWRWSFVLMVGLGAINLLLSFRLKKVPAQRELQIDWTGAALAAGAIILLSFGFSGLNSWGLWQATAQAPFDILGVSPAPILIILGIVLGQIFFVWVSKRQREKKSRVFDLRVLASSTELAVTACMAIMLFVGTAANFLIPLYMQVVQGLTGIQTSFSIIPYTISIFLASTFVATLYKKFPPRVLASVGFVVVACALTLIAFTMRGDWGQAFIVLGLILLGLGQGSIVALVFNTLLSSAPKELAGDVGAWRGLVHNLSGSVGIAVASAFAVGILASTLATSAAAHPEISSELISEVNINDADFLTNAQLESALEGTNASETELNAAVEINEDARLRALQISLLGLAALALLAIVPATRMPGRIAGELPKQLEPDDPDAIDVSVPLNPHASEEV